MSVTKKQRRELIDKYRLEFLENALRTFRKIYTKNQNAGGRSITFHTERGWLAHEEFEAFCHALSTNAYPVLMEEKDLPANVEDLEGYFPKTAQRRLQKIGEQLWGKDFYNGEESS